VWASVDGGPEARRRSGGAVAGQGKRRAKLCVCNARTSVLETPGHARDQDHDMTKQKQEPAPRRRA
jgi:hypothetical protein